jgi:hypothetical protein
VAALSWPIAAVISRGYGRASASREVRRLRASIGVAVIIELVYVSGWIVLLLPVLSVELWIYSSRLDPVVRILQIAGLVTIAAAAVGLWALWRISSVQSSRIVWLRNAALAAALIGTVWIAFAGSLISFDLNY